MAEGWAIGLSMKISRAMSPGSTRPFSQASYTFMPSPTAPSAKISTSDPATPISGRDTSSSTCLASRSGCIRSSASMRAIHSPRQTANPLFSASTRPTRPARTGLILRSARRQASRIVPLPSSDPSSTAITSKSAIVWPAMLCRASGRVPAALYTGIRTETRGVDMGETVVDGARPGRPVTICSIAEPRRRICARAGTTP